MEGAIRTPMPVAASSMAAGEVGVTAAVVVEVMVEEAEATGKAQVPTRRLTKSCVL